MAQCIPKSDYPLTGQLDSIGQLSSLWASELRYIGHLTVHINAILLHELPQLGEPACCIDLLHVDRWGGI